MRHKLTFALTLVFTIAAGAAAIVQRRAVPSFVSPAGSLTDSLRLVAEEPVSETRQLVVLYVGRASCGYCTSEAMGEALSGVRSVVSALAKSTGTTYRIYGVGVDRDRQRSLEHLEKLGGFDAVSAGDRWLSPAAGELAWGRFAGPRTTPQILILERMLRVKGGVEEGYVDVREENLLARLIGLNEIEAWLAAAAGGMPRELQRYGAQESTYLRSEDDEQIAK